MAKKTIDDEDRPRVHTDVHPDADPWLQWTDPNPPWHGLGEIPVQLRHDAPEAVYVDGVWVNPGEVVWMNADSAKALGDLLVQPKLEGVHGLHRRLRKVAAEERAAKK